MKLYVSEKTYKDREDRFTEMVAELSGDTNLIDKVDLGKLNDEWNKVKDQSAALDDFIGGDPKVRNLTATEVTELLKEKMQNTNEAVEKARELTNYLSLTQTLASMDIFAIVRHAKRKFFMIGLITGFVSVVVFGEIFIWLYS